MLVNMDNSGKETWATWIRTFLCSHDFSHLWLYQGTGDTGRFICSLKENNSIVCAKLANNLHCIQMIYDVYRSFKNVIMSETCL